MKGLCKIYVLKVPASSTAFTPKSKKEFPEEIVIK